MNLDWFVARRKYKERGKEVLLIRSMNRAEFAAERDMAGLFFICFSWHNSTFVSVNQIYECGVFCYEKKSDFLQIVWWTALGIMDYGTWSIHPAGECWHPPNSSPVPVSSSQFTRTPWRNWRWLWRSNLWMEKWAWSGGKSMNCTPKRRIRPLLTGTLIFFALSIMPVGWIFQLLFSRVVPH